MAKKVDYYEVLGVTRDADEEAIRAAYRRLAKALHPDVNHRKTATEEFKLLQDAFHALSDPVAKRTYDAQQRRAAVADVPDDDVDTILRTFDVEVTTVVKKKKKKKKPKVAEVVPPPPRQTVPAGRPGEKDFEDIPPGFGDSRGGIF